MARILVKDGTVRGVDLANGEECSAPVVASNADAHVTFTRLLDQKEFSARICRSRQSHQLRKRLIENQCGAGGIPELASPVWSQARTIAGLSTSARTRITIELAFDDAKYGQPSQRPILECTIPSVVDPTVAPPGKNLMSIFVQYAPYKLRGATWTTYGRVLPIVVLRS